MRSRAVREYMPPTCFAVMAAALGENDAAISYARDAMRRHDPQLVVFTAVVPGGEPFRALPEVQELFVAMGLPRWLKART
jgi:hypothetical protein